MALHASVKWMVGVVALHSENMTNTKLLAKFDNIMTYLISVFKECVKRLAD